jgi:hypothetical protein
MAKRASTGAFFISTHRDVANRQLSKRALHAAQLRAGGVTAGFGETGDIVRVLEVGEAANE